MMRMTAVLMLLMAAGFGAKAANAKYVLMTLHTPWDISSPEIKYAFHEAENKILPFDRVYYGRINVLRNTIENCSDVREIIANIQKRDDEPDMVKMENCLMKVPGDDGKTRSLKVESGLWLGYMHLGGCWAGGTCWAVHVYGYPEPEKADKYIKMALDIAKANCGDNEKFDNFCYYYGLTDYSTLEYGQLPTEFDTREKLYPLIQLLTGSITYEMLKNDPKLTNVLGGLFGSNRDAFLVQVYEKNLPPDYEWISVEDITKLDNYKKIARELNGHYGEEETGSLRFAMEGNRFVTKIKLAMFPDEIDRSEERFSSGDWAGFDKKMEKYADVKKAYLSAMERAGDYYKRVLKMPEGQAGKTAALAVRLLIMMDLQK